MSINLTITDVKPSSPSIGETYYDVKECRYYLYTGLRSGWIEISVIPTAEVADPKKVKEEKLCQEHPGLATLREELKRAQEKFDTYKALVDNYEEPK